MKPLISIITPSYNSVKFIEQTILSVKEQGYPFFEHIIIDGNSEDGTIDILKKYNHLKWISESDNGQSEAINKGIKIAEGEIVCWLNSDDLFIDGALANVANFFLKNPEACILTGNLLIIDENNEHLRKSKAEEKTLFSLLKGSSSILQPSTFFKKDVFEKIGFLNPGFHYAFDYEFWLRITKRYKIYVINEDLACFRIHELSKTGRSQWRFIPEILKARRMHKGPFSFSSFKLIIYLLEEPLRRIKPFRRLVRKIKTLTKRKVYIN